ncbi:MAG: transglutaminase-like family protein, partial [Burkholderiaceae bacterium]|nr:transglutaminase-like family protein [Burkholderiaceae bacterium]
MEPDPSFEWAVRRHDERVAELGTPIWVGSEPTFTDREAQTPAWLRSALGDDKERRAQALLRTLSGLMPGGLVLRSVGRLYPGEKLPRWNLGLLRRREGPPLWAGPPDPLLATTLAATSPLEVSEFANALSDVIRSAPWGCECMEATDAEGKPEWRVCANVGETPASLLDFRIHFYKGEIDPEAGHID